MENTTVSKQGCPYKRNSKQDCLGRDVSRGMAVTAICNIVGDRAEEDRQRICGRYWHEAALADIKPDTFCCNQMEFLFHDATEDSGYLSGGFDILKHPHDNKLVWRNFTRTRFNYCPFCGNKLGKPFCGKEDNP